MPLSCDCFPGCWGSHSEKWPTIAEPQDRTQGAFYRLVRDLVPYGSYVMMTDVVRVETEDFRTLVELHLAG